MGVAENGGASRGKSSEEASAAGLRALGGRGRTSARNWVSTGGIASELAGSVATPAIIDCLASPDGKAASSPPKTRYLKLPRGDRFHPRIGPTRHDATANGMTSRMLRRMDIGILWIENLRPNVVKVASTPVQSHVCTGNPGSSLSKVIG